MVKGEGYVTMETNVWTNKQTSGDRATQLIDTGIWVSQLKGWRCIFVVHKSSASKEFSWSRSFSPSRWVRWCKVTCWFLTQYCGTKHGLIVTIVIPRLRIGYNVQFRKKVRRRPRLSSLFLHWYGIHLTVHFGYDHVHVGELDSQGSCVSSRGLARLGFREYVGAWDSLCQWHLCCLLHRWVGGCIDI